MKSFKAIEDVKKDSIVKIFGASISNPKIYNGEFARVLSSSAAIGRDDGRIAQGLVRVDLGNGTPNEIFHFRQIRAI